MRLTFPKTMRSPLPRVRPSKAEMIHSSESVKLLFAAHVSEKAGGGRKRGNVSLQLVNQATGVTAAYLKPLLKIKHFKLGTGAASFDKAYPSGWEKRGISWAVMYSAVRAAAASRRIQMCPCFSCREPPRQPPRVLKLRYTNDHRRCPSDCDQASSPDIAEYALESIQSSHHAIFTEDKSRENCFSVLFLLFSFARWHELRFTVTLRKAVGSLMQDQWLAMKFHLYNFWIVAGSAHARSPPNHYL